MKTALLTALLLTAAQVSADVSYIQELNGPLLSNRGYTVLDDGINVRYMPTTNGLYDNNRPGFVTQSHDPDTSVEGITARLRQKHEDFMKGFDRD